MTREEVENHVKKHGSLTKAAKALGIHRCTLSRAIHGRRDRPHLYGPGKLSAVRPAAEGKPQTATQPGRRLQDFKALYCKDVIVPDKIREGLKKLGAEWRYEHEFCRLIQVQTADLSMYRHMFETHQVKIERGRRIVWCGTTTLARSLQEVI